MYDVIFLKSLYALISLFSSDGSYPKDEGSSQEVMQSLFVGESRNRGTNGGQNKYWGPGGADAKMRTLPRNRWGGANRGRDKLIKGGMIYVRNWRGKKFKSNWVFSGIAGDGVGGVGKGKYSGKNKQGRESQRGNQVVGQMDRHGCYNCFKQ